MRNDDTKAFGAQIQGVHMLWENLYLLSSSRSYKANLPACGGAFAPETTFEQLTQGMSRPCHNKGDSVDGKNEIL